MRNLHSKLTAVGGGVDYAAHLANGAGDGLCQQWHKSCCNKVDGGSIDEESWNNSQYRVVRAVSYWSWRRSTLLPKINRLVKHGAAKLLGAIFRTRLGLCRPHTGVVNKSSDVISSF